MKKLNLKSKARIAGPDLYKNKDGMTVYKNSDGEELCLLKFPITFEKKQDGTLVEDENNYFFEGYASTWSKDLGDDVIERGAFVDSLKKRRPKVLAFHDPDMLAGFSIEEMEDDIGLRVKGRIPKDGGNTPLIVPYMGEGGLDSLSIGFRIARDEDGEPMMSIVQNGDDFIRVIKKCELFEYSFVAFPMNPAAKVVLGATDIPPQFISGSLPDLPLPVLAEDDEIEADKHYDFGEEESVVAFPIASSKDWSPAGAVQRLKEFTESVEEPRGVYGKCFALVDESNLKDFASYRIPVCDVIDNRVVVVKEAVAYANEKIQESSVGDELKQSLVEALAPFVAAIEEDENYKFESIRAVERKLKKDFDLSGKQAKAIISEVKRLSGRDDGGNPRGNVADDITEEQVEELKQALLGDDSNSEEVSAEDAQALMAALQGH